MANGWTPERRARQAQQIKNWKPWEKATGPQTPTGKEISSQNALVHGMRSTGEIENRKRFNSILRQARAHMVQMRDYLEQLEPE